MGGLAEVGRLVAGFPLDVAADAGGLRLQGRLAFQQGVYGTGQVFVYTGSGDIAALVGYTAVLLTCAFALYALRAGSLSEGGVYRPVSREGALLLNNALLAVCCGVVNGSPPPTQRGTVQL